MKNYSQFVRPQIASLILVTLNSVQEDEVSLSRRPCWRPMYFKHLLRKELLTGSLSYRKLFNAFNITERKKKGRIINTIETRNILLLHGCIRCCFNGSDLTSIRFLYRPYGKLLYSKRLKLTHEQDFELLCDARQEFPIRSIFN